MPSSSPRERTVSWVLFALLGVGSATAIAADMTDDGSTVVLAASEQAAAEDGGGDETTGAADTVEPRRFTIAATGDILVHESVAGSAVTPDGWDFAPMFASVKPILSAADLALCHIESPMSPDNSDLSYYPAFNVPNQLATAVADAGYDSCSVASNHSLDTGSIGVNGTLDALDSVGVRHAGMARSAREAEEVTLLEVQGVTVAHLSYAYGFNSGELPAEAPYLANLIDEGTILSEAAAARAAGAEFVVLSLHWGVEYQPALDAMQSDLGPRLLGSDAIDLVIGHHAHVIQPVTAVNGEYLVNGLGNFLSNQSPETCTTCPAATQDGVIIHLEVDEVEPGRFAVSGISHTPTWVDVTGHEIVPVLDDPGTRDPSVLAASADRTADALGAAGVVVPEAVS